MTKLSAVQIAELTAAVTGGAPKRAATRDAAAKRFIKVASEAGLAAPEELLDWTFDNAREELRRALGSIAVGNAIQKEKRKAVLEVAAKAAPKAKAEKPAKAAKTETAKEPTKREIMLDMVCSKTGATEAEICERIGWKACFVTLKRAAAASGVALRVEKQKGERARYFGSR